MTGPLVEAWGGALLAEVSSVHPVHGPDATVVVPLLADGRPALALPYAQLDLARRLADAEVVLWTVAVPGLAGHRRPVAAAARVEVEEDPDGARFTTSTLLAQLVSKHPPSRARLDGAEARRAHGWYVPRLLVRTVELGPSFELGYLEAIGVTATETGDPWVAPATALALADGTARLEVPDGPAAVLQHGADVPALETPWQHRWHGTVRDGRFSATARDDVPMARRRPTPQDQAWAERALRRACERGLRDAGR